MSDFPNTPAWWSERAATIDEPARAACWSPRSQDVRFNATRSRIVLTEDDTVLDFGCGTAAFADYLPSSARWFGQYFGLDWAEGMRERARLEHPRAVILAELDDDLVFDHVVCIGPFNLRENWSKEQTWETLEELWTMHTRKTLVVSLYAGRLDPVMLRHDLHDAADLVEWLGTPQAEISTRHLPNDLLVAVWK